jgi:hypothetical protein
MAGRAVVLRGLLQKLPHQGQGIDLDSRGVTDGLLGEMLATRADFRRHQGDLSPQAAPGRAGSAQLSKFFGILEKNSK